MRDTLTRAMVAALAMLLLGTTGCDDDDDDAGGGATATATVTRTAAAPTATATLAATAAATATPTPTATAITQAGVAGLVVVSDAVSAGRGDGLHALPPEAVPPSGAGFDRGLGSADWVVDDGALRGTTNADGTFHVTGLAPGRHALRFTKTVGGNLMEFYAPIIVGDDGSATVRAEVSWGLVRTLSRYTEADVPMEAIFAPTGAYLITRAGQPIELFDGWRTLVDGDGDGAFDPQGCGREIYTCGAAGCASPEDVCICVPSCPDCQDCTARACVPRTYFHTPECGPDGLCKALPYQCGEENTCGNAAHTCTCVASCVGCDDCRQSVCIEPCVPGPPLTIDRVAVFGTTPMVVGQSSHLRASATLSDGSQIDVTWFVAWESSEPGVATIDAWGQVRALASGETAMAATLVDVTSAPLGLTVVERPTLQRIMLISGCHYPLPSEPFDPTGQPRPPVSDAFLPPPICQQVLRVGGTLALRALGVFDTGYHEDITDEVTWTVSGDAIGSVADGLFTASAVGDGAIRAALAGVTSEPFPVRVVAQATVVALSVYPGGYPFPYVDAGPVRPGADAPCFECGYALTLLRGDTLPFRATAHYDTGEWEEVSTRVTWRSSNDTAATVDTAGVVTAAGAGEAAISATLEAVESAPVSVHVVDEATLQQISIYMDGADRAIGVGDQATFHAVGFYDVGFSRDLTDEVTWRSSDDTVGGFDTPGTFTGRGAGDVTVWAELGGQRSEALPMEVFATSALAYCDPGAVNRGTWADDFNRVMLESDCATYTPPDVVELRFTVTETQRPGGIFDPCLDLYAYRGETLVRTIREEGCGDPFLAPGAPEREDAALRYQLKAFWDLKDERGATVAPGTYTIHGRFYLYYDPIVSIDVTVTDPEG